MGAIVAYLIAPFGTHPWEKADKIKANLKATPTRGEAKVRAA